MKNISYKQNNNIALQILQKIKRMTFHSLYFFVLKSKFIYNVPSGGLLLNSARPTWFLPCSLA